ncbi:hypothetical protein DH2020_005333 [Rehmannia glutinosa]|uniref:Pectinesterase inhibitor domain-containing protein n=1 Tax=Rehmannia glutinosa TaxID=99300 RepID=A0ABR0XFY5_REHGL
MKNILCIFLVSVFTYYASCLPITPNSTSDYIKTSCQTTLYPKLCNKYLTKYAIKIKADPKLLATTALLVAFNTTCSTSETLRNLSTNRAALKPSETEAVAECVEVVSDSVYELQRSMKELNDSCNNKGPKFDIQMNDVLTWVSAALTDDDTCMDDFMTKGEMRSLVRGLVLRIARLTSIALAFVNHYYAI